MGVEGTLAREARWARPVGLATLAGVVMGFAGFFLLRSAVGSGANFEGLLEAHKNTSSVWVAGVLSAASFALLTAPLLYLFRAAQARSPRVRSQLVGIVI